jgi:two-component system, cell cycle response regulator
MVIDKKALVGIPTIPAVAMRLLDAISDPEVPIPKLVDIIKADPGITAKLLKAANSPFYGGGRKIDSLDRAVVWLGKHAVSCLALSFSLADNAARGGTLDRYYQECWLQSVIQGLAMELLANRSDKRLRDSAFVTGLLMDVGRLALLQTYSTEYIPVIDAARNEQRRLREVEQEFLHTTHPEISADLLAAWSLPPAMGRAVCTRRTA